MTNASNQKNKNTKVKDILTLIRLTAMQPEQLKLILPMSIIQAISFSGKNVSIEEVSSIVREKILQDSFMEKFVCGFDKIFSHKEVKLLINFYQSEAMKKFFNNNQSLFNPIYDAYRHLIGEVLEAM
ncbi:MAG: hypothetical protein C5B45_05215 [Chlamydiae bacterium]|nr:MAG: hypothetical protein C5B45_05215 [Chlamydiota bacterium]